MGLGSVPGMGMRISDAEISFFKTTGMVVGREVCGNQVQFPTVVAVAIEQSLASP